MRPPRLGLVGLVLTLVIAFIAPRVARAEPKAEDPAAAAARDHYQRGTSYYDLGRYPEAIHEFEAAYQIKNDPALLYNLAQSNRLAGNSEQALHFYRTYLRYVPKVANRAEIEDRIKQLDQLVAQKNAAQTAPPTQTIPPPASPNLPNFPAPEPAPVLTAPPGAPPAALPSMPEPISPMPGEPPPGVTTPFPPPPPANDHHQMIRAGEITAAAGGILFIIGAAYGAAAVGAANEVNNEAKNGLPFDPSVEKRGKNAQTAEAVLMTMGVLAGGTGAVLFFYGKHLAAQERATVTPMASTTGAGLSLRVTF